MLKLIVPIAAVLLALSAYAGRPLNTDDASAAPAATCQVETWHDRASGLRNTVAGAACGIGSGVEIGAEVARARFTGNAAEATGAIGFKWAPEAANFQTAAGALRLGVKAGMQGLRDTGNSWSRTGHGVTGLASLEVLPSFALHANLALERQRGNSDTEPSLLMAAVWSPSADGLLFAEFTAAARSNGGGTRAFGGRYWIKPEKLGLDISASKGPGGPLVWTAGLGIYGLGLR
jgi:hypothetical protein